MKSLIVLMMLSLFGCNPDRYDLVPPLPPIVNPDNEGDDNPIPEPTSNQMKITIANSSFSATLTSNSAAREFEAMLPLTLRMSDFNRNEKVCTLPAGLPTSASNPGTIHQGDLMLYGSSSIVLFYETFQTSYSYTKIGQIDNPTGLKNALGAGDVTVKFELE